MADAPALKRFYKSALREPLGDGRHGIRLDGRPVRTPERAELAMPSAALADAIVAEWEAQGERIDPATMPMTGLANATIDRVLPDVPAFAAGIAAYAASDLFCYRASEPEALVADQAAAWDPPLGWARERFDIALNVTSGIMPVEQPPLTLERLGAAVCALDPWLLAGFSTVTALTGSLIGALALIEGRIAPDALWTAAHVDDDWQERQWGSDAEAVARHDARRREFDNAVRYCALVKAG